MNHRNLMAAAIAACALFAPLSGCEAAAPSTPPASFAASGEDHLYQQDGLCLRIPRDYDSLLLTKVGTGQELFSVAERASIEAAKKEYAEYEGAGWLFAIGKISASELHEMLCNDMTGRKLFAQDNDGSYYIFYHPTDVRYMRETPEAMQKDQELWSKLCFWAWNDIPKHFIDDNNLISINADNSSIGIYLARVIYKPGTDYTVSKNGKKALTGNVGETTPFVNMLLYGNTFEMISEKKKPQGEYLSLTLPSENVVLDFFQSEGSTYVLEKRPGLEDNLYKAVPIEEHAEALSVMQDWHAELVANRTHTPRQH